MSAQSAIRLSEEDEARVFFYDTGAEVRRRFRDIKADLAGPDGPEATNEYVLSVLCDLYWLHSEEALNS